MIFFRTVCLLGVSLVAFAGEFAGNLASGSDRPNVLIILADDLGYGDLQCYNSSSKIPTPNLDRLAAGGVRFTDAHTPSSVCTPTRYGLLTGRYCWRTSLKKGVLDGFDPPLVEPDRMTLANFLSQHGYATACVGKWHLGMNWTRKDGTPMPNRLTEGIGKHRSGDEVDFKIETTGGPIDCGFDSFFGISASLDMSPYGFIEGGRMPVLPTEKMADTKELAMSVSEGVLSPGFTLEGVLPTWTRRVNEYIESRHDKENPFFLYVPLASPHLPVVPNKEWRGKSGIGDYGDFVAETDASVGVWLDTLDATGLAENTIVIFTSDNGGLWHKWDAKELDDIASYQPTPRGLFNASQNHHSNGELRGTKADIWEGGHRVPFIVRWPAMRLAMGKTSSSHVELNDVFATLAEIVGEPLGDGVAEDSFSFASVVTGTTSDEPQRTFSVHHSISGVFSLREGPWKYVPSRGSGGFSQPKAIRVKAGEETTQLYNLETDASETRNVSAENRELVDRMAKRLEQIQASSRTRP